MRISDWSSDVCASDLISARRLGSRRAILRQRSRHDCQHHYSTRSCEKISCPGRDSTKLHLVTLSASFLSCAATGPDRAPDSASPSTQDRKRVVTGRGMYVRYDLDGRLNRNKKK